MNETRMTNVDLKTKLKELLIERLKFEDMTPDDIPKNSRASKPTLLSPSRSSRAAWGSTPSTRSRSW